MKLTGRGMTLYGEAGSSPPLPYIEVSDEEAAVLLALDPKRIAVVSDDEAEIEVKDGDPVAILNPDGTATPAVVEGGEPVPTGEAPIDLKAAPVVEEPAAASEAPATPIDAAPADSASVTSTEGAGDAEDAAEDEANTVQHTAHAADLADAFDLLSADDMVATGPRTGKPKVGAVKEILDRDVTADEIDAAWAARDPSAA